MSFERPTLSDLVDRVQEDLSSRLELEGSPLRRSMVYVLARVIAGAAHMLHGHLEYLSRQIFADQADEDFLRRIGRLFGVDPIVAEFASGNIIATGTDGTDIDAGTVLVRSDGSTYETDSDATLATVSAWVALTAHAVAGILRLNGGNIYELITPGTTGNVGGPSGFGASFTDGTCVWRYVATADAAAIITVTSTTASDDANVTESGVVFSFESPIAGVDAQALVAVTGIDGGADEEPDDDYRVRVLERLRAAPHGGVEADYVAWAKEVSGVTRAWVTPLGLGAGTVVVRFVRDDDASPIPDAGEVAAVQAVLDANAPAHCVPTAVAPTGVTRSFTLSITPDTAAIRAAVEAELADLVLREGEPGGTIYLSQIRTAIGTAAGLENYTLASPSADLTHTSSQIPVMGTVTFT